MSKIFISAEEGYLNFHPTAKRLIAILNDIEYTQRDITWEISSRSGYFNSPMDPYLPIQFRIRIEVKDVQSGGTITLYMPQFTLHEPTKDEWILRMVYDSIRTFEMHELDEHFFYKGDKIYDPHKNDPQPQKELIR